MGEMIGTFWTIVRFFALFSPTEVAVGGSSAYWPGDSMRTGTVLACDRPSRPRRYRRGSVHVAMRAWWRIGCGTKVLVCSRRTARCAVAPVLDGGPWMVTDGKRRKVWVKQRPPKGWRFRAVADLSRALWRRLGRPPAFSRLAIYYAPAGRRYP